MSLVIKSVFAVMLAVAVQPAQASSGHTETPYGVLGHEKAINRVIDLTASEYAFNQQKIVVKKGETIKFVLKNSGQEEHEMTIGDAAMQQEHRKMMAAMPGMAHSHMAGHGHVMHGNTVSAKQGETKSLIWHFTQSGRFEFACNFPGHAELGMQGIIEVR